MAKRGRKKAPRRKTRTKNVKKKVSKGIKSQWNKISAGAGGLAFLSQITSQDMQNTANLPIGDKAKVLINSVSGRITGYNPFPNGQAIPQTIGIDGIFNKWSGIGLATWIFGNLPMKVPHKQKAKVLGRNLLTGGILAGIFTPTSQTTSPTNMSQISISAPVSSNAIVGGTQ